MSWWSTWIGRGEVRRGAVAFTPQLGPMVRFPGCTSGYDLFMQAELDEEMAELSRLLYVATTRAADYLILSSGLEDLDRPRGPWLELLRRQFDLGTGAVADNPQRVLAKVIREEPPLGHKPVGREKRHDLQKTIDKARKLAAAGKGQVPELLAAGARRSGGAKTLFFFAPPRHDASSGHLAGDRWPRTGGRGISCGRAGPRIPWVWEHWSTPSLPTLPPEATTPAASIEALVRRHAWLHLPDATAAA